MQLDEAHERTIATDVLFSLLKVRLYFLKLKAQFFKNYIYTLKK